VGVLFAAYLEVVVRVDGGVVCLDLGVERGAQGVALIFELSGVLVEAPAHLAELGTLLRAVLGEHGTSQLGDVHVLPNRGQSAAVGL